MKQNSISFSPKLAPFFALPILVTDLIIHSSSQETTWNAACITIILNSHILLILSQWYWPVLLFSSLSFHFSFDSHLFFLEDINSTLTHLPVFSLLSLHSFSSVQSFSWVKRNRFLAVYKHNYRIDYSHWIDWSIWSNNKFEFYLLSVYWLNTLVAFVCLLVCGQLQHR